MAHYTRASHHDVQVNDEVKRYNSMLAKFQSANDDEWEAIVAVNRGQLQRGFFEHMQCLMAAEKVRGGWPAHIANMHCIRTGPCLHTCCHRELLALSDSHLAWELGWCS